MKAVAAFLLVLCYLAATHAWNCWEGPQHYTADQIDAGHGQVVMRDRNDLVYFLSGKSWYRLGTVKLKHVSVGPAGMWGTDSSNRVYKYIAGDFVPVDGLSMQQVDAGGDGQVVGVTRFRSTYCLKSTIASSSRQASSLSWDSLSRILTYYSCGPLYGCWGTDSNDQIFVAQKVVPKTCETSSWLHVAGASKMVEVGTDGTVMVLNSLGNVYQRVGISSSVPQGTNWVHIPICMPINHLSYDLGVLWVVTTGGTILQCTQ